MPEKQGVANLAESAFRRHYEQVYRYVRRRTETRQEAEDVVQLVFADAVRALERFKPGAKPVLALLYTVAQRRLTDAARRRTSLPAEVIPLEEARAERESESDYGSLVAEALHGAIARLPKSQQEVVVAKLLEGRPYAEIAQRLGASETACRMRLSRALQTLRTELEERGMRP